MAQVVRQGGVPERVIVLPETQPHCWVGAGRELTESFCRADPEIARHFARVTFLSDNRPDLARITTPSLILQCSEDVIAPDAVGSYVHSRLPGSRLVRLAATGHCPNLSAPAETVAAIRAFLAT